MSQYQQAFDALLKGEACKIIMDPQSWIKTIRRIHCSQTKTRLPPLLVIRIVWVVKHTFCRWWHIFRRQCKTRPTSIVCVVMRHVGRFFRGSLRRAMKSCVWKWKILEETGSEVLFHPTFLLSKIGHFWVKPISTFGVVSLYSVNYYGHMDQRLTSYTRVNVQ